MNKTAETCKKILEMENASGLCERLMATFNKEYESDDESWRKKGLSLLDDYINGTPDVQKGIDYALMSLCGWTLHSLLVFAKLENDTEGLCANAAANYDDNEDED